MLMQPIIKIIVVGLGVRGTHWLNVISNHKLAIISVKKELVMLNNKNSITIFITSFT